MAYHFTRLKELQVKCQSKCSYQKQSQKSHFQIGLDDVYKHEDIDPRDRPLLEKCNQYNPSQEDCYHSKLPLPVVHT